MTKLGNLYTDFSRIDLDTRGGYARVSQVKTRGQSGYPDYCAIKIMRHEINFLQGMERFEDELKMLSNIVNDSEARLLTHEPNLIKAAKKIIKMGPRIIIIKKAIEPAIAVIEKIFCT